MNKIEASKTTKNWNWKPFYHHSSVMLVYFVHFHKIYNVINGIYRVVILHSGDMCANIWVEVLLIIIFYNHTFIIIMHYVLPVFCVSVGMVFGLRSLLIFILTWSFCFDFNDACINCELNQTHPFSTSYTRRPKDRKASRAITTESVNRGRLLCLQYNEGRWI